MSSISLGGVSATLPHPGRGSQQVSPLREKMHDLVDAARTRPELPADRPTDLSPSERLEQRIEHMETRAAEVATHFETLTANMQSRLEARAERATEAGNEERAARITGMAGTLATRIETVSARVSSHFEAAVERMRERLEGMYGTVDGTTGDTNVDAEAEGDTAAVDIQA